MTKRYARRGGDIPEIYPGELKGLIAAMRDARAGSGRQTVWRHDPPAETVLIRVFKGGEVVPLAEYELEGG